MITGGKLWICRWLQSVDLWAAPAKMVRRDVSDGYRLDRHTTLNQYRERSGHFLSYSSFNIIPPPACLSLRRPAESGRIDGEHPRDWASGAGGDLHGGADAYYPWA